MSLGSNSSEQKGDRRLDFRYQARLCVANAKRELAALEDHRIKYAALELRYAMEALTYERASKYAEELPKTEYETWQPRKLMEQLLDIDPTADKDSTISIGIEDEPGVPAKAMQELGSETVLSFTMLKKHYDALGSFLHMPTLKQLGSAKAVDYVKLRARSNDIIAFLEKVLASTVFNSNFAIFADVQCENCGSTIRKRMPHGAEELSARCPGCDATYKVRDAGNGNVQWRIDGQDFTCSNAECSEQAFMLRRDIKIGTAWRCRGCGGVNQFGLGLFFAKE